MWGNRGCPYCFPLSLSYGKKLFLSSHRVLVLRIYIVDQHAQGLQFQKLQLQATLFILLRRAPENERQMSTIGLWESRCFRVFSLLFLRAHALVRPWETGGLLGVLWRLFVWCYMTSIRMLLLIVGSHSHSSKKRNFWVSGNRSDGWKRDLTTEWMI